MGHFVTKNFFICFWPIFGQKSAYFWPIFGLVQSLKILTRKNSDFMYKKQKIGAFYTLEKPEKKPEARCKKARPEARKSQARPARNPIIAGPEHHYFFPPVSDIFDQIIHPWSKSRNFDSWITQKLLQWRKLAFCHQQQRFGKVWLAQNLNHRRRRS